MGKHVRPAAVAAAMTLATLPGPRGLIGVPRADATPAQLFETLNRTFEEFRTANDARLKAVETRGAADTVLNEKVDRINGEITNIVNTLQTRLNEVEAAAKRPAVGAEVSEQARAQLDAFNRTLRAHARGRSRPQPAEADAAAMASYRAGFDQFLRIETARMAADVMNAMQVGSDPDGGYLCPPEIDAVIDRVVSQLGAMRGLATVRTIGGASFKKRVKTSGASAGGWGNERTAPSETGTPGLAELTFTPGTLWAEPEVTSELLEDASIDVAADLADEVGLTFAEQEGDAFINGDGKDKPRGILNYPIVANASYAWGKIGYVASGGASDFAASNPSDALIDLMHAAKRQYRANATWLMNDPTLAKIRKFKDGQGNYLWVPGLQQGMVGVLLGKPVGTDDFMPDVGANAYPIAFGDFRRGYLVVDRRGTVVLRDPYTAKPYVKFYTSRRVGGGVQNFEAIKLLKIASS